MRRLRYSSRFKKDFKKYKRNPVKVEALRKILSLLVEGNEISKENKPHIHWQKGFFMSVFAKILLIIC